MTEAHVFGESLGDSLNKAMKKETIPKGICKCRLLFAKEAQTDIWVWLTWGGYDKLAGIGGTHEGRLSFVADHDGGSFLALPTNHQEEPFSVKGLLSPSNVDIKLWKELFDCKTMPVLLSGSTIRTLVDIEESHHA